MSSKWNAGKRVFEFLVPKPSVGKKSTSKLNISTGRMKGAAARLKQTFYEAANPKFRGKDFTFDKRPTRTKTIDEKRYEKAQIKKD